MVQLKASRQLFLASHLLYFNSAMVQLKEMYCAQFYCCLNYFNSAMVQLKVSSVV